jgi:hypothetical protein
MSPIPKHPKKRGEWVELQFMARAASHGLTVCKPWGDTTRYDFVVEHASEFCRVQVKSTAFLRDHFWACRLPKQAYTANQFDYLVVYVIPEDIWYIIPFAAVGGRTSILLLDPRLPRSKYLPYLEAWQLLTKKPKAVAANAAMREVQRMRRT